MACPITKLHFMRADFVFLLQSESRTNLLMAIKIVSDCNDAGAVLQKQMHTLRMGTGMYRINPRQKVTDVCTTFVKSFCASYVIVWLRHVHGMQGIMEL